MLAYAAQKPRPAGRAGSPRALTLIIAGHATLIAAVMTAKMDVTRIVPTDPPIVINVPPEKVPPPDPEVKPQVEPQVPQTPLITQVPSIVPVEPIVPFVPLAQGPIVEQPPAGGSGGGVAIEPPRHVPVLTGPRLATAGEALKPPYPADKLRQEEEATLKLRLTIDARGRVTAVDPVGRADPSFLAAARRHILKSWRSKPAMEDGVAVPTTTVINLSFRLEEA